MILYISVVIDIIGKYKTLDIGTIFIGYLDIDKDKVVVKSMNILCYIKNIPKYLITYTINSKVSVEITDLIELTTWGNIFICNGIIKFKVNMTNLIARNYQSRRGYGFRRNSTNTSIKVQKQK